MSSIPNENDKSEVMCISFSMMKKIFLCGHKNGVISAWIPDQQAILKIMGLSKFHDNSINKILFKDTQMSNAIEQFVMTCSSDGTLKVFKSDQFENIASKNFDAGVLDIFQTFDYEKTEYLILSLDNGDLIGLNLGLETVFKIPSILGSKVSQYFNIPN
jgi:WD40 repeat protein